MIHGPVLLLVVGNSLTRNTRFPKHYALKIIHMGKTTTPLSQELYNVMNGFQCVLHPVDPTLTRGLESSSGTHEGIKGGRGRGSVGRHVR